MKSEKANRQRHYLALELPTGLRLGLVGWQERALKDPALAPVPAAELHLCLLYLGLLNQEQSRSAMEAVRELPPAAFELALNGDLGRVPVRGRTGLLVLYASCRDHAGLRRRMQARLSAHGVPVPPHRLRMPHLTVARLRRDRQGELLPLAEVPAPPGAALRRRCHAVRLTLYRSKVRPQGSEHIPMVQVELTGSVSGEVIN